MGKTVSDSFKQKHRKNRESKTVLVFDEQLRKSVSQKHMNVYHPLRINALEPESPPPGQDDRHDWKLLSRKL